MAERRMFAKTIIDSDDFLDMPLSSQALYFHLSMRADDDGFVNNPRKIQRMINASDDDLRLLVAKNYIIPFDSGIVVIKHWKIHNYIQSDRYKKTLYEDEKSMLTVTKDKKYEVVDTQCIQDGYKADTQVRLGKDSIGNNNNIYSVHFEELWSAYPRHKEKSKAYKCYQARLKDGFSEEELLTAVKNYAEECKKEHREEKYIKLCATFLGPNTPFVDYLKRGNNDDRGKAERDQEAWEREHAKQIDAVTRTLFNV